MVKVSIEVWFIIIVVKVILLGLYFFCKYGCKEDEEETWRSANRENGSEYAHYNFAHQGPQHQERSHAGHVVLPPESGVNCPPDFEQGQFGATTDPRATGSEQNEQHPPSYNEAIDMNFK